MLKKSALLFLCTFGFCQEPIQEPIQAQSQEQIQELIPVEKEHAYYPTRFSVGGFYHNRDHLFGEIDLLLPFIQSDNFLFFGNIRGLDFEKSKSEMNLGLGFRVIFQDILFGIYSFYDRKKSEHKNFFSQITAGIEAKTKRFTFDANAYIPFGKKRKRDVEADQTELRDGIAPFKNIWFIGGKEVALYGFDGEIGYEVIHGVSFFVGGFYFNRKNTSKIMGPQGRIEVIIDINKNNRFSVVDRIHLEAGVTHDHVRKSRAYAGIRLSWDLGEKGKSRPTGLHKRMTEYVRRDFNIVTAPNNAPFQRLNHPDGSPYTVIVAKNRQELDIAIGNNPNIVALDGASGGSTASTLNDDQFFTGGIFPFGDQHEIRLSNGGTIENGIILGKNNTLRDLTFENAQLTNDPTTKPHVGTLLVEYVSFNNLGSNAIEMVIGAAGTNSTITLQNNTLNVQSQYGIFIERQNAGGLTVANIDNNNIVLNANTNNAGAIFITNGSSTDGFATSQNINFGQIENNTITINATGLIGAQGITLNNTTDPTNKSSQTINNNGSIFNNSITINNGNNHAGIALTNISTNTAPLPTQIIAIDQISSNSITIAAATNNQNILILNTESLTAQTVQTLGVNKVTQNHLTSNFNSTNIGILLDNEGNFVQKMSAGFNDGFFENQIQRDGDTGIIRLTNNNTSTFGSVNVKVNFFGENFQDANNGAEIQETGSDIGHIVITP
ncbi:MAG: Invasin [Chlamydiae bacterium]|nr:Invasin [Chlamydiota bacterium]